ncbi:alpha-E domain-containing protein [Luteipulveratus sp. YIM 133132]|uniref:alpha-E domain-containing protein n=1 Tax=Luteipulveratus flavus TaxID=3031728 RepID=UPI0023AF2B18|nr:alpha-E domain-containing protein [Luteipulveratus sp. YIM 133132]MDE9364997.1 alpha-E domain-containing protein [Luteipulveratus sp. YIM 133132]
MLSRIAEALFWIGRYIERAECTSRILDAHLQVLTEDPTIDREATCRALLAAMGVSHDGTYDQAAVLRLLFHDRSSSASVVSAIDSARESARRSREVVSTEMWEAINTTYNETTSGQLSRMRPADAFRLIRERASMIAALADGTLSHDTGWQFLVLGRSIERVDMTARLLLSTANGAGGASSWQTTLRACGAHHAFTRTYRAIESPRAAAEFLLLDRLFPRSVVFGLTQAAACLEVLDPRQRRLGFGGDAARIVGQARASLDVRSLNDLLSDLPGEMERLQRVCVEATDAVTHRYFEGAVAPEWLGGTQ